MALNSYRLLPVLAVVASAYAQTIGNGCPVLPSDNIWNTPVDTLPVSANSDTYVNTIGPSTGMHADFGAGMWDGGPIGIPFVVVPGTQQKYPATFLYWDESDPGPYAVPQNAPIEGGSNSTGDRHAIAVDGDNCILYELYRAFPQGSSWNADSGAIFDLRSNALRPAGWTSGDAAGLPIMPGLVRYDEVAAGEIRHAIRLTVPQTQRLYIWPARHYASSLTDPKYPPMGQRFRLKAGFDVSTYPADVQVILRALKKYGMILADNGSAWFISGQPDARWNDSNLSQFSHVLGSNFEAVDESSLMINPDSGQARQGASVTVSPASASLSVNGSQQFTATVQGSSNQSVTWGVNGVAGGNTTVGLVDASGLYSAPSAVPNPPTVSVQATSVAVPSATGSASVTIKYPPPSINSVTPNPMLTGSFTLTVNGNSFRTGAVVKLNGTALATTYGSGTQLTATGTIWQTFSSAPVTVTNSDGQVSAAYNIAINPGGAVTVAISPTSATLRIRRTQQFTATVHNAPNLNVTWKVNGITGGNSSLGTISASGLYTSPGSVPSGGKVTVSAVSVSDTTKSASATVTITKH